MLTSAFVVAPNEYAYVNIPKAACTSIKMAIAEQLVMPFVEMHRSRRIRRPVTDLASRSNLFRWTFVRHPGSRLVSCWTETQPPQTDQILRYNTGLQNKQGMAFAEFVRAIVAEPDAQQNPHYAVQWRLLAPHGTSLVDAIFRFEELGRDWTVVRNLTKLGPLGHYRQSEHGPWRSYYDHELRALVEQRYAVDFEKFGYGW